MSNTKTKKTRGTHFRAVLPADVKAIIARYRDEQLKKGTWVSSDEKAVFELIKLAGEQLPIPA